MRTKVYFGKVCTKHPELEGERSSASRNCVECHRAGMRKWRRDNKAVVRKRNVAWNQSNKEYQVQRCRDWLTENREYNKQRMRNYHQRVRGQCAST